jgi:hypothetical protein
MPRKISVRILHNCNILNLVSLLSLLFLPFCTNFKLLNKNPSPSWLKLSKSHVCFDAQPVGLYIIKSRLENLKCKPTDSNGDERSMRNDKGAMFTRSIPIIELAKSFSRVISRLIGIFCSKYGPIQRLLRGLLFEFKIAKRAWRQESKRSREEFQRQRQVDVFESLSGDVDSDVLTRMQLFQPVNTTELQVGASRIGTSNLDTNQEVWENEEARFEYEQQKQFYKALGIFDRIDADEALLSSEYDKYLNYTAGKCNFMPTVCVHRYKLKAFERIIAE